MNNERVLAQTSETIQIPADISGEVLEAGLRLGLSLKAVAGIHLVEPSRILRLDASGLDDNKRQREIGRLEEVGSRILRTDAQTFEIVQRNWNRSHGSIYGLEAAEFINSNPIFAYLSERPTLAADMASPFLCLRAGRRKLTGARRLLWLSQVLCRCWTMTDTRQKIKTQDRPSCFPGLQ